MTVVQEICSLSTEELEARRAWLGRGLRSRVRERRSLRDGVLLRFDDSSEIRAELEQLVAFERECCPTLDLAIRESEGELELEVRGLDPDSDLFEGIGPETNQETRPASPWRRVISAAGFGTLGALTLCCVLPMMSVALFGGAVVAPLTSLDDPWVVSSTALALAAALWLWQRRRSSSSIAAAASDCAPDGGCGC
jgi:hypothetical protein